MRFKNYTHFCRFRASTSAEDLDAQLCEAIYKMRTCCSSRDLVEAKLAVQAIEIELRLLKHGY